MKADMLASQFATLEEPQNALVVDAALPPNEIVDQIQTALALGGQGDSLHLLPV
jgi:gluconokinase